MKLISSLEDNQYPFTFIDHVRDIARGIVINDEGKIAILKVDANDDFGIRDCYELPGGGVDKGETYIQAFSREMREEIGCTVKDVKELGLVKDFYNLIHRENHNYYFIAKVDKIVGTEYTEYELNIISKVLWVSIDEAIQLFSTKMIGGVGKLVQARELPILQLAKDNEYII